MSRTADRRITGPAVLALAVVLAACATASPSELASVPGSAAPSVAGTPAASVDETPAAAQTAFSWQAVGQPVVTRTLTGIDERYVNPGAVIEDGGTLHMFANVFTAWPGHVSVPHLVSTDGLSWTLAQPDPVLTSDDVPFADPGADVSSGFVTDDGTWVLVIESVSSTSPWQVGLATAPGPDGPWTVQPTPVLGPGSGDAFDAGGIHGPSVVRTPDGFAMYYTGFNAAGTTGSIGRATSTDGMAWTRDAAPVLSADHVWDFGSVDRPRVARTPDGYAMVFAGLQLTDRGVAFSPDGVNWMRDGGTPAITAASFPITGSAWDAALVVRDGQLLYFLEIGNTNADGTNVYAATAPLP